MAAMAAPSLDDCGDLYKEYIEQMNNLTDKTWIVRQLFEDTKDDRFYFMGSYMTFPQRKIDPLGLGTFAERWGLGKLHSVKAYSGEELKQYYEGTVDAHLFDDITKKISYDLKKAINKPRRRYQYICFLIGGIVQKQNVSHHIGFIYKIDNNELRMLDPGIQSWGPQIAEEVKSVCLEAFKKLGLTPKLIETYTTERIPCGLCIGPKTQQINPQDITLGVSWTEGKRYLGELESVNREAFCQSWSVLLMLADVQKIKEGVLEFDNPNMNYWNDDSIDLEVCIRQFILWVIKRNVSTRIFEQKYLEDMEKCFQMYNPDISIPNDDDTICNTKLNLHPYGQRERDIAAQIAQAQAAKAQASAIRAASKSRGRSSARSVSRGRGSSSRSVSRGRGSSSRSVSRGSGSKKSNKSKKSSRSRSPHRP